MSRELNPELFPELTPSPSASVNSPKEGSFRPEDFRLMANQLELLKKKLKEHESRYETVNTRLTDFTSAIKSKFERLAGITQRLEEMTKAGLQDLATKQSQLMSRVNERKVGDAKIQELVDRHNQLVQTFDVRLTQMQKVISEQDMQLMSSRAELKEAQREITRLKRM